MTTPPANSAPPPSGYTPSPEALKTAEEQLARATPEELSAAARAWVLYSRSAGGRSSITGAELPGFYMCPTLVRAAWLAVVRDLRTRSATPPIAEPLASISLTAKPGAARVVEPVRAPVAAVAPGDSLAELCRGAKDLAEAVERLGTQDTEAARTVTQLVKSLSRRLRARMKQL